MRVVLEGKKSSEVTVHSGVPQGTVLRPILFLCHINDLPDAVKSQVRLFADDCLLYRPINSQKDHDILQQDINNLETWAENWGMRFNAKKCYILSIKQKSSKLYPLPGHILEQVKNDLYLGLQILEDMKWSSHINNTAKKVSSTWGFLSRNLKYSPKNCKKTAYITLARSIMDYGGIIWDPYLKTDVDRLERIQHQAARFITCDYKTIEPGCITKMLINLELPTLEKRRTAQRLIFMFKVV